MLAPQWIFGQVLTGLGGCERIRRSFPAEGVLPEAGGVWGLKFAEPLNGTSVEPLAVPQVLLAVFARSARRAKNDLPEITGRLGQTCGRDFEALRARCCLVTTGVA